MTGERSADGGNGRKRQASLGPTTVRCCRDSTCCTSRILSCGSIKLALPHTASIRVATLDAPCPLLTLALSRSSSRRQGSPGTFRSLRRGCIRSTSLQCSPPFPYRLRHRQAPSTVPGRRGRQRPGKPGCNREPAQALGAHPLAGCLAGILRPGGPPGHLLRLLWADPAA
jgi:hypothetical protein